MLESKDHLLQRGVRLTVSGRLLCLIDQLPHLRRHRRPNLIGLPSGPRIRMMYTPVVLQSGKAIG